MESLQEIESDIWQKASVNREHLLAFLRIQPSTDGPILAAAVRAWLQKLHADPHFSKVHFPSEADNASTGVPGDAIERVLTDLSNYGYLTHETQIGTPPAPHDLESQ